MSWQHIQDTKPKARNKYRCYLCGFPILKGERYTRRVGVCDGDLSMTKMHDACESKTKSWTHDDWEFTDEWEFRKVLQEK